MKKFLYPLIVFGGGVFFAPIIDPQLEMQEMLQGLIWVALAAFFVGLARDRAEKRR